MPLWCPLQTWIPATFAALSTTAVLRGTLLTAIVSRRGKLSDGEFKQNSEIPELTSSASVNNHSHHA